MGDVRVVFYNSSSEWNDTQLSIVFEKIKIVSCCYVRHCKAVLLFWTKLLFWGLRGRGLLGHFTRVWNFECCLEEFVFHFGLYEEIYISVLISWCQLLIIWLSIKWLSTYLTHTNVLEDILTSSVATSYTFLLYLAR